MPQTLWRWLTIAGAMAGALAAASAAEDYPPMDHGGAALILADGDRIWGEHIGLSRFEIPTSVTVKVRSHIPDTPQVQHTGWLIVHADEIVIAGVLDASGAGYTGGGGYGGNTGAWKECVDCPDIPVYEAEPGERGPARYGGNEPDGPAKGELPGEDGGYDIKGTNADDSVDTSVLMGSGGQGGHGGESTPPSPIPWLQGSTGGGGGGGGGPGGGAVSLYASSITVTGRILTNGVTGGNGFDGEPAYLAGVCPEYDLYRPCLAYHESYGGDGGGQSGGLDLPSEGLGGRNGTNERAGMGGAGGGGGLLLYCDSPGGLGLYGELNALGGREQLANGGTIKIFYTPPFNSAQTQFLTPRLYLKSLGPPLSADNVMWMLY